MVRFLLVFITVFSMVSNAYCGLREDLIDDLSIWVIRLESRIDVAHNKDFEQGKIYALVTILDHLDKYESLGKNHF